MSESRTRCHTVHAKNLEWEVIRRRAAGAGYRNVSEYVMACSAAADPAKVVAEHRRLTTAEETELLELLSGIAQLRHEILRPALTGDGLDSDGNVRCPNNIRDALHAIYLLMRWQHEN